MAKKLIRLTEGDLHRIVKGSVNRILRENEWKSPYDYFKGGAEQIRNAPKDPNRVVIPNFDRNKDYTQYNGQWMSHKEANDAYLKDFKQKEKEKKEREALIKKLSDEADIEMRKYVITKKELCERFPFLNDPYNQKDESELLIAYQLIFGWQKKMNRKFSISASRNINSYFGYWDEESGRVFSNNKIEKKLKSLTDDEMSEPKFYHNYIESKMGESL